MKRFLLLFVLVFSVGPVIAEDDWGDDDWDDDFASEASQSEPAEAKQKDKDDDPWESFNRKMFTFNESFDKYAFKPTAQGYKRYVPRFVRKPVNNFSNNIRDFRSGANNILQWRWKQAGHNLGRFFLNTTLGIGGLFNVASSVGLKSERSDLGITLARWGVPEGPYLMLPFLGPSTVRDASMIYPETYLDLNSITHRRTAWTVIGVRAVDIRAELLDYEDAIIGDRYNFIREFYLQDRRNKAGIDTSEADFDFGGDDDWDDDDW